jgi:hypothetical protein
MVGIDPAKLNAKVQPLLPDYMTMGHDGMSEHVKHIEMGHMAVPANSIPMIGAKGPHDYITMGGMFTIVKVREKLESYADPGWYVNPPGTQAMEAPAEELKRDGIA